MIAYNILVSILTGLVLHAVSKRLSIMIVTRQNFIETLTQWLLQDHDVKTVKIETQSGARLAVEEAIVQANMEPVRISMQGLQGVDMASASKSPIAVTFKRKVIIVYDYDAIVSGDQSLLNHVNTAIRTNMVPIVLVGKTVTGKAATLPIKGYHTITIQNDEYEVIAITKDKKDTFEDKGIEGAINALRGRHDLDYRGDGIAFGGVFDNYLTNSSRLSIDELSNISDTYSWSEATGEVLCENGMYEDPYTFVPVTTAAAYFSKEDKGLVKTFGQVWSKTNAMYAKMNSIHALQTMVRPIGYFSQVDGFDHIRNILLQHISNQEYEKVANVAKSMGITASGLLSLMRLWKCKYTLSIHAKIKAFF